DLEVVAHRGEAAGGYRHDDEVGVGERGALVGGARGAQADAAEVGDVLDELDHARDRRRVDVLDHDLRVAQRRSVREVDEELGHPLIGAAADDGDASAAHWAARSAAVTSTSTGAPRGSAATPMALRVWRP